MSTVTALVVVPQPFIGCVARVTYVIVEVHRRRIARLPAMTTGRRANLSRVLGLARLDLGTLLDGAHTLAQTRIE